MRSYLSAIAWAILAATWGADAASAQDVSWGLKGGVTFASLSTAAFDTSTDPSGSAGGFVGIDLGPIVRLQPEVYWSVRRFAASAGSTPFAVSARGVEIPVLLQVRLRSSRPVRIVAFAGPQIASIGRVTQKVGTTQTNISDQIKNRDVAMVVGGGVERAFAGGAFVADVRALIGTRNLAEASGSSIESRAFHVLVGYRF
jgi:hypothetical protein